MSTRKTQRIKDFGSYTGVLTTAETHDVITGIAAGEAIQIREMTLQALETGGVTAILYTSGDEEVRRFRFADDGDGFSQLYHPENPFSWPVGKGVSIALSDAIEVAVFISYDIIDSGDAIATVDFLPAAEHPI